MSDLTGNPDEMERFARLLDDEMDRLVAGQAPASTDLDDLAAFSRMVRETLVTAPSQAAEMAHLAVIAEAVQLQEPLPDRERIGLPRRRTMLSVIFGTLAAKIAAVSVAAAAATGGLAATGSLPAPAQDAVASAVSHVGVNFPTSDDRVVAEDVDGTENEVENENEDGENGTADESEHGKTVSDTARNTDKTGREKGEEVSGTASTKSTEHRQDADRRPANVPSGEGSDTGSKNPTGYGKDSQPSGNPTEFGPSNNPAGKP